MSFASPCHHGLDDIIGYTVRRTYFDDRPSEDVEYIDGPQNYDDALTLARRIRQERGIYGHAVVDPYYKCGCRGRG